MANVPLLPSQLKPATSDPAFQKSVGVQAKSPTNNISATKPVLAQAQIAPKDLSGTYANVGGTIYNKQAQTKFSNPADFFKDSGVNSFDNLKFDMGYTPNGKETIYGQATPQNNQVGTLANGQPNYQYYPTTSNPAQTSSTPPNTSNPPANSGPYTPPNGGTTGVSSGGIIGNLISTANSDPNLTANITNTQQQIKDLQTNEANDLAGLSGNGTDLGLATGQTAVVQNKYSERINAQQGLLASLLSERGQNIGATTSAGQLNAPITNPQTGGLVSPSSNSTLGATTSGATNLSSLIGVGNGSNGHPAGEYFVNSAVGGMQANQGFSSPQQLADFINQQMPGANATAQNVFQLLSSGALNGSNGGGNSALNPLTQVNTIAQQVLSGQVSPSQALSMGGTIPNWQSVLNAELMKQSGGSYDQSALQARYDSNQQTQTNQGNQVASWKSASQQATNLGSQLNDLLSKYNLNPNSVNIGNQLLQLVAQNTSDPRYITLQNLVTDLANTYANVLTPPGGSVTDMVRSISSGLLGSDNSGGTIKQVIQTLDQQVQAKIAGVSTGSTTNNSNSSSNPQGWF